MQIELSASSGLSMKTIEEVALTGVGKFMGYAGRENSDLVFVSWSCSPADFP